MFWVFCKFIITGGAFQGVQDTISPFGYRRGEGVDAGKGEPDWIVAKDRYKYDSIFETLSPADGKVTGAGTLNFVLFRKFRIIQITSPVNLFTIIEICLSVPHIVNVTLS